MSGINRAERPDVAVMSVMSEGTMVKTMRDPAWWYWLVTVGLLAAGIAGRPWGIPLAMVLCAGQIIHFGWRAETPTALPVQVRVTYLLLLVAGLWPPLQWIHVVQLLGTSAGVLIGYCLLARTLSLVPWNRRKPLSLSLVRSTFFSTQTEVTPCGSVLQRRWHEALEDL
jgi:hypothetical protein